MAERFDGEEASGVLGFSAIAAQQDRNQEGDLRVLVEEHETHNMTRTSSLNRRGEEGFQNEDDGARVREGHGLQSP